MNSKNFKLIVILNLAMTLGIILLFKRNYNDYQTMPGALHKDSFLYMIGIEAMALTGLVLLLLAKKAGLFIYITSLALLFLYPLLTGTADTVLGLLVLPVLIIPIAFIIYYLRAIRIIQQDRQYRKRRLYEASQVNNAE